MGTIAFKNRERPDIFYPVCDEGHDLDCFDSTLGQSKDLFLLDRKGWLYTQDMNNMGENYHFQSNGRIQIIAQCNRCIEKSGLHKKYSWVLDFTFGLLRHAWPQPYAEPDIGTQVQPVHQRFRL